MISYPRTKNGSVDNGTPVNANNGATGEVCPCCGKKEILETISAESCRACGHVVFDYWPKATNS